MIITLLIAILISYTQAAQYILDVSEINASSVDKQKALQRGQWTFLDNGRLQYCTPQKKGTDHYFAVRPVCEKKIKIGLFKYIREIDQYSLIDQMRARNAIRSKQDYEGEQRQFAATSEISIFDEQPGPSACFQFKFNEYLHSFNDHPFVVVMFSNHVDPIFDCRKVYAQSQEFRINYRASQGRLRSYNQV